MASNVEQWNEIHSGVEYVCFRTERGELFHFRKNRLKRGKPCAPFNTIEEFTRSVDMLTLKNAEAVSGIGWTIMRTAIKDGKLLAIKKIWHHGRQHRHGLLVNLKELQEWIARRAFEKHLGKDIEWDMTALGVLGKHLK